MPGENNAATTKSKKRRSGHRGKPLKARVMAPIGPNGEHIPILEYCNGVKTYLVPDEVRIAYLNGLLIQAAEMLSKL